MNNIQIKILLAFVLMPIVLGLMFFVPAGTINYWQGWAYILVLTAPMIFVLLYFLKKDPEFLERRMRMKEKETKQQLIIKISGGIFLIGFLIPGFDRYFGWSQIPDGISFIAMIVVFLGYAMVFLTFKENSYAGRTIEVEKGQYVISTGPYSIVRHPMYVGTSAMFLATPIALGSYVAFPIFLLWIPLIIMRILNEEEVLKHELKGYEEYCNKTKYRLVPFIW